MHHECKTDKQGALEHHNTVWNEILCHLPYAIFSVACAMICLSILNIVSFRPDYSAITSRLFHNFHFLHLLFAATGTMLTFRRFSQNPVLGLVVGFCVPTIFCTLSDAFLPYLGGILVHLPMKLHWCFFNHLDTVIPFLFVGVLNGWIMSHHATGNTKLFFSIGFHFFHIFISSMASILYLVSFGFSHWSNHMGFVFVFLITSVLVPCTLSDIIVPMFFAIFKKKK